MSEVGPQGFEPWTKGLKVPCSTAELRPHGYRTVKAWGINAAASTATFTASPNPVIASEA